MAISTDTTTTDDSTPRQPIPTPTNLDLDFDINFGDTLGLNFSTGSNSSITHGTAGCSAGSSSRGLLSPTDCMDQDVARSRAVSWRKGKARRIRTEPILSLDVSPSLSTNSPCTTTPRLKPKPFRSRNTRSSSGSRGSGCGSTDSSLSSDSDQATSGDMRSRSNWGTVLKMTHPFGHVDQRYVPSPLLTPYYTANSTPNPESVSTGVLPQAGPSHLPPINTTISITVASPTSSPHDLTGTADPVITDRLTDSPPPPSPAPTADFSMISPPNSPSFVEYYLSESHSVGSRGAATLPFFRSNSGSTFPHTGLPGVFHWNGRSHSVSLGKPRRVRPGISRLWDSIASPAKSSPALPLTSPDASASNSTTPPTSTVTTPQRNKATHVGGFSAVRGKTSPMMGVGRKLREKRRVKRTRQLSRPDVDTDVDYGALDPLDGEEGELVGCVCTGWGDGACVCGYGYWDVYDYDERYTREVEPTGDLTPSPLTQLPTELFLHVLSYLPVRSVLAVTLTCKTWRVLALDNSVWWRLWQAREGTPRLPSLIPNRNSDHSRRGYDCFTGLGRRYRGVKDEGVHGLSLNPPEHEHDEDQWDAPSGWAIDFERAKLVLKEGSNMGMFVHPGKLGLPDGQLPNNITTRQEDGLEKGDHPRSRLRLQSPLILDWHRLYRDRAVLEQRWRDPEGEPHVLRIEGHRDSVYCLDFDSSRIITGSRDRTIKVWCIKTGACIATFEGHTGSVLCLKFERDWDIDSDGVARGFMVSGSSDCTVCVWDLISTPVATGESDTAAKSKSGHPTMIAGTFGPPRQVSAELRQVLRGHSAGVLDLKMDDRWIVTCSKDALMNVYDRKTLTLHTILSGHEGPVNAVGLENGRVVSASGDGKMMLWDVETGSCIRVFEGHEKGLACIEFKNDLILSGSNDCTIKLWRASTGECLHTFAGHTLLVRALYFEPKTGYIVSTSYDKSVRVWEWREPEAGEDGDRSNPKGVGRLVREFRNLHSSHVFDVKFDVGKIVSTSHDQKIVVLDFSYGIEGAPLFA
ncbi:WD40-repeat-containing domain protein [Scleroderma yunnanense]